MFILCFHSNALAIHMYNACRASEAPWTETERVTQEHGLLLAEPPDVPRTKRQLIADLTWETRTVKDGASTFRFTVWGVSCIGTELGTSYKSWFNRQTGWKSEFVHSKTLNKLKITPFPRIHQLHVWMTPIQLPVCRGQFKFTLESNFAQPFYKPKTVGRTCVSWEEMKWTDQWTFEEQPSRHS